MHRTQLIGALLLTRLQLSSKFIAFGKLQGTKLSFENITFDTAGSHEQQTLTFWRPALGGLQATEQDNSYVVKCRSNGCDQFLQHKKREAEHQNMLPTVLVVKGTYAGRLRVIGL
jgi:hypothetical protein